MYGSTVGKLAKLGIEAATNQAIASILTFSNFNQAFLYYYLFQNRENLLKKNAENSGAGQYFTPRSIISAMVECVQPQPMERIADPSCGTGGFFLGALNFLNRKTLKSKEADFLKFKTFHGWEIEKATARLCLMNLFLHGVGV